MDKYEYNLKIDQIKSLCAEENYEAAAELCDTINWGKVKNVSALVRAGEVYEKMRRYDDSREILMSAYDRSPIGRTIIYRLAEVAIKMQDFAGAEAFYQEFVEIAPHDNLKYVLRYEIRKAQGAELSELIQILEDFKELEYNEEWAYELAYLYHKAEKSEDCVNACDELILWFGDGPYVERALELKMLYQPLTKVQEEKYRRFRLEREGITSIGAEEMKRAGEYVHDPVEIPQVSLNPERFNTINLQEEIAKGMRQISEATEKETVSDTMDSIKKIVEEIPYLQLPKEDKVVDETAEEIHIETDEEIDGSLQSNFREFLGEESDGQISLVMTEQARLEKQITGQMTIQDVLDEWDKTSRAAEAALQEADLRKLESAKARALQEAEDIMDRLNDVIPKLDAGITPKELLEEKYMKVETEKEDSLEPKSTLIDEQLDEAGALVSEMNSILSQEINRLADENALMDEQLAKVMPEETEPEALEIEEADLPEVKEETPEEETSEIHTSTIDTKVEEKAPTRRLPSREEMKQAPDWRNKTTRVPDIALPEDLDVEEEKPAETVIDHLTEEQKSIFSYFVPVKGMEDQLCKLLTGVIRHFNEDDNAGRGNIVVQGGQGCGKTVLATSIIKVLQKETGHPNGRVGKIDAKALNKKDIRSMLEKVAGGCLIIERVGDISRETAVTLSLLLEQDDSGLLVILEDTSKGIKKAFMQDDGFAKKFTEKVTVPIFTNDELVSFARSYAKELGYEIDEMAVLALYNRISNIQRLDQATTLVEVKEIVDDAIAHESRGGLKKAFSILTASRYTDGDYIILREKDFE